MNLSRLAKTDLNLLVSLNALLENMSVSRAATQLNLTQSAMSKTLTRLRLLFDDPLLVRQGQGMKATPRAEALFQQLQQLLPQLEQLLQPACFDPASSDRTFRLSVIDGAYTLFFPKWLPKLRKLAPHIRLECFPAQDLGLDGLIAGQQELAITAQDEPVAPLPNGLRQHTLMTDRYLCVAANHNPRLRHPWQLATFLAWPQVHIHCEWDGDWLLDSELARLGHQRQVMMQVSSLQAAMQSVLCSDLLTILPAAYAAQMAQQYPLTLLELPMTLPLSLPPLRQQLIWHQRSDNDPGLKWLTEFFIQAVQQ
ncbi:LysR family transcriptional regulator [Gallaecimonas mangrovi]|uniref:LysR family transcriptional regulator n=1 Tax=Gallaecimonas mangrovi TaxID=2291597 RepID=UPI000E202FC8|nr:LysR family transcriptional regulator [Gallaecimonas mangrovi]